MQIQKGGRQKGVLQTKESPAFHCVERSFVSTSRIVVSLEKMTRVVQPTHHFKRKLAPFYTRSLEEIIATFVASRVRKLWFCAVELFNHTIGIARRHLPYSNTC